MRYIKGYSEYITELQKFLSKSSGSGRTKEFDIIYDDPTSARSTSAGVLLKNKLASQEFMDKFEKSPDLIDIKDLMSLSRKDRRLIISKSNQKFLKQKEKEGELRCEYCNNGPLRVYDFSEKFNKIDGATADHKVPISKGGPIFDHDNLVVCCYKCNNEKEDMNYEDWINKIKNKNGN